MHVIRHHYKATQPAVLLSADGADLCADAVSFFRRQPRSTSLKVGGNEENLAGMKKTAKAEHATKLTWEKAGDEANFVLRRRYHPLPG
jgi:hypothetical protein